MSLVSLDERPVQPGSTGPGLDWVTSSTLELALRVRSWHGIGSHGPRGVFCKHCMPDAHWPCTPFNLAQGVIATLTRDEPYGPPPGNEYLQWAMDVDVARTDSVAAALG